MTQVFDFDDAFKTLAGHPPFPWQRRLFHERLSCGNVPSAVDIPTGLGKTAVMAVWLLARAAGADLPRRLVYVVDRRAVVDQATVFAEALREKLSACEDLEPIRRGLKLGDRPLPISTLRGRYVDNREWMADPAAPAIIVGTVDMVGSRLLFEGYGVSRRMRPYAAGLMGCDTLVMLDEAHLSRPFENLLRIIERERRVSPADSGGMTAGKFAGPAAGPTFPPPFRVLPLSATLAGDLESDVIGLDDRDRENATVQARLEAAKTLTINDLEDGSDLDEALAERAWRLAWQESETIGKPVRTLIYCNRRADAEKVFEGLRKRAKEDKLEIEPILLVGGRRVHERQEAADDLKNNGLIAGGGTDPTVPVFLVATSAGEVGVDLDADHMVCDLVAWERMVQRLGRVNRLGTGQARVLVVDQGPPDEKKDSVDRHDAVRSLLEALPRGEAGGYRAGPAALAAIRTNPALRRRIDAASTRPPLYPALTRPLVDAWAMTSLAEHSGRPEAGPWLRGWVDEEPQTTVVWRRYLPVRFEDAGTGTRPQRDREVAAFFEAAPPHTAELLETETRRVVDWLRKRARKLLKQLEKEAGISPDPHDHAADDDLSAPVEDDGSLAPMSPHAPIAFLLDSAGRPEDRLSSAAINDRRTRDLQRSLAGRRLVVDARFGGIVEGLLDDGNDEPVSTIEDNWGQPENGDSEEDQPLIRVRALTEDQRTKRLDEREARDGDSKHSSHLWREALAAAYRVSPEGETTAWLVVDKRLGGGGEEAKAIAPKAQRLDEHHAWAAEEAARIADAIGLDENDRAMLVAAAGYHDNGKKAPRWQRAFNAKRGGDPYAKTSGPINHQVLNGYRHEFGSTLDAEKNGLDGIDRSDPRFALALHLIAAHHGRARPDIGVESYDDLPPTAARSQAHEIALRFARLQGQWGPWGLAWWEALLRAADQRASRALDEQAARERAKAVPATVEQGQLFAADATGTD